LWTLDFYVIDFPNWRAKFDTDLGKPMSFHEHLEADDAQPGPSNRNFGYTVGCVLLAIAAYALYKTGPGWLVYLSGAIGGTLVVLATLAPDSLTVPNRLWMGLGHLLFRIVNPVIMVLMYAVCFIPIVNPVIMVLMYAVCFIPFGLVLRLVGYDPLKRRFDPKASSYWVEKQSVETDQSMKNQF
jgi:hypothetical protein